MAYFGGQQSNDNTKSNENASSGLRRPKEETVSRLLNNQGHGGGSARSSNLSVDAPEFVPRAKTGYSPPVLSASAPEFVPRHIVQTSTQPQLDYDFVLEEFQQTLMILNTQPGNVEEYMRPLCDKFRNGLTTAEQMTEIIDILFVQSTQEPNFRYTGARICQHIDNNLKDHPVFKSFRNAFLKRCQREYEKREDLVTNPDTVEVLTGFTMFMGELFLNLEIIENGRKKKMKILPSILKDLILTLLSQPSKTTIKCTCQLLKLVGSGMEDMMSPADGSPSSSPFDEVFSQLQRIKQSATLDDTCKLLINSVLNLRLSNWGRPESTSSSQGGDSEFNGSLPLELVQNEPVFYNASGQTISREEAGFYSEETDDGQYILNDEEEQEFLAWQAETGNYNSETGYPNTYDNWSSTDDQLEMYGMPPFGNEDEMDDETEAAFEEFLMQAQNKHRGPH